MASFKERLAELNKKKTIINEEMKKQEEKARLAESESLVSYVKEEFRLLELKIERERVEKELAENKRAMFDEGLKRAADKEAAENCQQGIDSMRKESELSEIRLKKINREIDSVGDQKLAEFEQAVEKRLEIAKSYDPEINPGERAAAYSLYLEEKLALLRREQEVVDAKIEMTSASKAFSEKEKEEKMKNLAAEKKLFNTKIEYYSGKAADVGKEGFVEDAVGIESKNVKKGNQGLDSEKWDEWLEERENLRTNKDWSQFHDTLQSQAQALHDLEKELTDGDRKQFEELKSRVFEAKCPLNARPGMSESEKTDQREELSALDDARERYRTGEPPQPIPPVEPGKKEAAPAQGNAAAELKNRAVEAENYLYHNDFKLLTMASTFKSASGDFSQASSDVVLSRAFDFAKRRGRGATMDISEKDMKICQEAVRMSIRAGRRLDHLHQTVSGKIYGTLMPQSFNKDVAWAKNQIETASKMFDRAFQRSLKFPPEGQNGSDDFTRRPRPKQH